MSDNPQQLDPTLAARLPPRLRSLLEQRLPFWKDYESNLGILMGLRFGLLLAESASCTAEQIRDALDAAVKLMAARLDQQVVQQLPHISAKHQQARFTHEMIAECEIHDPLDPKDGSLDELIRELEEKHGLPPEAGAA